MGLEERRKREKEGRKNAILKAARKLSFEKGFKSITVASIAKKAELSKGAVYLYFNSKEEIYVEILLKDIDKFHSTLTDICERGGTAADMLRHFSDIYVNFFISDKELFRILMSFMLHTDEIQFSEQLNQQLILATNATVDIIERIFKYGIERGEFPENTEYQAIQECHLGPPERRHFSPSLYRQGVDKRAEDSIHRTGQAWMFLSAAFPKRM